MSSSSELRREIVDHVLLRFKRGDYDDHCPVCWGYVHDYACPVRKYLEDLPEDNKDQMESDFARTQEH